MSEVYFFAWHTPTLECLDPWLLVVAFARRPLLDSGPHPALSQNGIRVSPLYLGPRSIGDLPQQSAIFRQEPTKRLPG